MADKKITQLTTATVIDPTDLLYIIQNMGTTPLGKKISFETLASNIVNGWIVGGKLPIAEDGRLTLTSGKPANTSDVTGAGTLYFSPYKGDRISLRVSSGTWATYTFTEVSKSLAGIANGRNYDVFIYDNAGALTLELQIWDTDTARSVAIGMVDGIYLKAGDYAKRYLGTIRASASGVCEDSVTKRFVWNYYNRLETKMAKIIGSGWSYSIAGWRQANNDATNQVEFLVGVAEEPINAEFMMDASVASTVGYLALSLDTSTGYTPGSRTTISTTTTTTAHCTSVNSLPSAGYHAILAVEYGSAAGITTSPSAGQGIYANVKG
jgi:hypothetical protein